MKEEIKALLDILEKRKTQAWDRTFDEKNDQNVTETTKYWHGMAMGISFAQGEIKKAFNFTIEQRLEAVEKIIETQK